LQQDTKTRKQVVDKAPTKDKKKETTKKASKIIKKNMNKSFTVEIDC
jgi:hypothetical protein